MKFFFLEINKSNAYPYVNWMKKYMNQWKCKFPFSFHLILFIFLRLFNVFFYLLFQSTYFSRDLRYACAAVNFKIKISVKAPTLCRRLFDMNAELFLKKVIWGLQRMTKKRHKTFLLYRNVLSLGPFSLFRFIPIFVLYAYLCFVVIDIIKDIGLKC